jgi:hypothetical protein
MRPARTLAFAQIAIGIAVSVIAFLCLIVVVSAVAGSSPTTVAIALLVALVPSVILVLNWTLVAPLVVIERRGSFEALRASSGLVEGRRIRLLGALLVFIVAATLLITVIGVTTRLVLHGWVESLILVVAGNVTWTLGFTAFATAVYYRLVGDRHSGAISVANVDLERWAGDLDRRRSANDSFRI